MGEKAGASWKNPKSLKIFLETCIEEVSLNGRKGASLEPESWMKMKEALKIQCGVDVEQKQMKNCYDYLKEKYQVWYMLTTRTGNIYERVINTFKLTNEEWNQYIKTHPKASTLRTTPLLYPNLCKAFFDGATTTVSKSSNAWASSSKNPKSGSSSSVHIPIEDAPTNSHHGDTSTPSSTGSNSFVSLDFQDDQGKDTKLIGEGKRTERKREKQTPLDEEMVKLVKKLNEDDGPSVETCLAKLDRLGWNNTGSLYAIICARESYRRGWMHLGEENHEKIEDWVKTVGKSMGYVVD